MKLFYFTHSTFSFSIRNISWIKIYRPIQTTLMKIRPIGTAFDPSLITYIGGCRNLLQKNNETGGSSKESEWCNPIQLYFLAPKKSKSEVWGVICSFHGTVDYKVQDKQKVYTAMTSMLLYVVSKRRGKGVGTNYDLKKQMIFLKDALYFTGKTSQSLNKLKRAVFGTNNGLKNLVA